MYDRALQSESHLSSASERVAVDTCIVHSCYLALATSFHSCLNYYVRTPSMRYEHVWYHYGIGLCILLQNSAAEAAEWPL